MSLYINDMNVTHDKKSDSEIKVIRDKKFDEERALYASEKLKLVNVAFDGPADGESALKESRDITVQSCYCNLRYPFWHCERLKISDSELTPLCRAALWYTHDAEINSSKLHGIKAVRECRNIILNDCDIVSPEFGWSAEKIEMRGCTVLSEYFLLRARDIKLNDVSFSGKYSFQYIENATIENCRLDTKDAFWHAKNVLVKNCEVRGEYLGWYSQGVTFENCNIYGTQPLCYCKNLKLINCRMTGCNLAFEKSGVDAVLTAPIDSIKNFYEGEIRVPAVGEIISDDPRACGKIYISGNESAK